MNKYNLVQLKPYTNEWVQDMTQPVKAAKSLTTDPAGNPVFVDDKDNAWHRLRGVWSQLEGTMCGVAWGGDGSMFRKVCSPDNSEEGIGYIEAKIDGSWERLGG